ncbi:MAG TPA: hypothetical protein VGI80_08110 [Pyrinomonadaceae bacterium]|jgi:hypothetical protein
MKIVRSILFGVICAGALVVVVHAQDPASGQPADTTIPRNSRFYIQPMDGFETYLAAAMRKKEVPIVIVTDLDLADFIVSGTHDKKSAGWAKTIFLGDTRSNASASMQVTNIKTHVVVYADSSDRSSANRGERSTAEKLAKYLKQKIEDDEKKAGKTRQ